MADAESTPRPHRLSPSAWNRYETCPRMYWLSRQRLPRKAGMAASLGTAVHASVEDVLNFGLDGRDDAEKGWLPQVSNERLKARWIEEKEVFLSTPRRPEWSEKKWPEAVKQQRNGLTMLLEHIGMNHHSHEEVTVGMWRRVQALTLAVEGELITNDGRLLGRLDLLLADVNAEGEVSGWLVADLKTGRPPKGDLKPEVNRQLRMYRDILLANNPNAPTVRTEGWYTQSSGKYAAVGDNVLEDAYAAWQATQPSDVPLDPTPGPDSCGGFCDWKAWCPHWWSWRQASGTLHRDDFSDTVVLIHDLDPSTGAAVVEPCEPLDDSGRAIPTGQHLPVRFDGRGLENMQSLLDKGHHGPVFLGSVMMSRKVWRIGSWCDVLPWSPISP